MAINCLLCFLHLTQQTFAQPALQVGTCYRLAVLEHCSWCHTSPGAGCFGGGGGGAGYQLRQLRDKPSSSTSRARMPAADGPCSTNSGTNDATSGSTTSTSSESNSASSSEESDGDSPRPRSGPVSYTPGLQAGAGAETARFSAASALGRLGMKSDEGPLATIRPQPANVKRKRCIGDTRGEIQAAAWDPVMHPCKRAAAASGVGAGGAGAVVPRSETLGSLGTRGAPAAATGEAGSPLQLNGAEAAEPTAETAAIRASQATNGVTTAAAMGPSAAAARSSHLVGRDQAALQQEVVLCLPALVEVKTEVKTELITEEEEDEVLIDLTASSEAAALQVHERLIQQLRGALQPFHRMASAGSRGDAGGGLGRSLAAFAAGGNGDAAADCLGHGTGAAAAPPAAAIVGGCAAAVDVETLGLLDRVVAEAVSVLSKVHEHVKTLEQQLVEAQQLPSDQLEQLKAEVTKLNALTCNLQQQLEDARKENHDTVVNYELLLEQRAHTAAAEQEERLEEVSKQLQSAQAEAAAAGLKAHELEAENSRLRKQLGRAKEEAMAATQGRVAGAAAARSKLLELQANPPQLLKEQHHRHELHGHMGTAGDPEKGRAEQELGEVARKAAQGESAALEDRGGHLEHFAKVGGIS